MGGTWAHLIESFECRLTLWPPSQLASSDLTSPGFICQIKELEFDFLYLYDDEFGKFFSAAKSGFQMWFGWAGLWKTTREPLV